MTFRPGINFDASKFPFYGFYPGDFMRSGSVQMMDHMEELMYRRLLDFQWDYGSIPDGEDPKLLARAARMADIPDLAALAWARVSAQFPVDSDGHRRNGRMERERDKVIAQREAKQRSGQAGGKQRSSNAQAALGRQHSEGGTAPQADSKLSVSVSETDEQQLPPTARAREAQLRSMLPEGCHEDLRILLVRMRDAAEATMLDMLTYLNHNGKCIPPGPAGTFATADEMALVVARAKTSPGTPWSRPFVNKILQSIRNPAPGVSREWKSDVVADKNFIPLPSLR